MHSAGCGAPASPPYSSIRRTVLSRRCVLPQPQTLKLNSATPGSRATQADNRAIGDPRNLAVLSMHLGADLRL